MANGLFLASALRNFANPAGRFRHDAAPAPLRPLLGPGGQQRELRGNDAADLERKSTPQRYSLSPRRGEGWGEGFNFVTVPRLPPMERLAFRASLSHRQHRA